MWQMWVNRRPGERHAGHRQQSHGAHRNEEDRMQPEHVVPSLASLSCETLEAWSTR